jgi:hypothetical protein
MPSEPVKMSWLPNTTRLAPVLNPKELMGTLTARVPAGVPSQRQRLGVPEASLALK